MPPRPVLHAGADQQAELGAIEHEEHRGEDDEAEAYGEQAELFDRHVAEDECALQTGGAHHRPRLRAPQREDDLLGDDHAAHGDQDLFEVEAIHGTHDDAIEGYPQGAGDCRGSEAGAADCGQIEGEGGTRGPAAVRS